MLNNILPSISRGAVLGFVMAFVTSPAFALDISSTQPPAAVQDGLATVGSYGIKLPEGPWQLLSSNKSSISPSPLSPNVAVQTGYFALAQDGKFVQSFILTLPESGYRVAFWNSDPCTAEGRIHKMVMDGSLKFPQCLLINRHESLHRGATGALFTPVLAWASSQNVALPAAYDIHYIYRAETGHGHVRVYVPTATLGSDQAAIDWGKQLVEAMRPMIERNTRQAVMPALTGR